MSMKKKMKLVKKNLIETTNQVMDNNRKSKRAFLFFFASVAMLLSLMVIVFSPTTTVRQIDMKKSLSSAYLNNQVNNLIAKTTNTEVVRMLPYDFSAPKNPPDKSNYYKVGEKSCYKDSTIEVTCWKEVGKKNRAEVCFAEVKIKHPSQFRRQWANGDYNSSKYQYPTNIFALSNGVIGMSSDFYKFRKFGVIVQYGNVICDKRSPTSRQKYLDVLVIDYNGDFKIWKDKELSDYIKENGADDIMLSFTFGPALIENGVPYDPKIEEHYPLGEPTIMRSGRCAIAQLGPLHYLLCTYGKPGLHRPDFPEILAEKGCITAYNLDGGQSGTLIFNGEVYNKIAYKGSQRPMSDVLYFASAEQG